MADNDFIMLKGARVSFPHLFKRPIIDGEERKYGAVLMLDPKEHKASIAALEARIDELSKEKFKGRKPPPDKLCLRDGEDRDRPEYEGYMVLSANSKDKPVVLRGDGRTVITSEEDSPIYAGCYVNAKVRLWAQDNQFGKRINCDLVAIQFVADGEALDSGYVSQEEAMEGFDAVNDDDDFLGDEAA